MKPSDSKARRKMFEQLNLPVSKMDVHVLRWKQRVRLVLWEGMLRSLLVVKRGGDLLVGALALVLTSPLFVFAAVCIIIDDGFPVIYTQKRVGLNGREFRFYKFRSMCKHAAEIKSELVDPSAPKNRKRFKIRNDPRVLSSGRFLRHFSIDELPQLFNVLAGDLSLVGPRPPLPEEVQGYSLAERKRLHVKPGMTCLWQIYGRSDISFDQQVGLDLQYIQSQSIVKDVEIMLKTIPAVLLGRGAY